jgi:protocatechuate 3,4-dioxygenase beta subunit
LSSSNFREEIMHVEERLTRRQILMAGSLGAAAWLVPGAFAEELWRTPAVEEGPFYPDRLPLDTDNDLVIVGDSTTPAVGEITHLTGRVLSRNGSGLANLVVEIWQVDGNGAYRTRAAPTRRAGTATSRASGASRRTAAASTASARSSRWRIPAVARTSTSRSSAATASC